MKIPKFANRELSVLIPAWEKQKAAAKKKAETKKSDRFEREAWKAFHKWAKGPQTEGWVTIPIKLLRREHAWMERMIEKMLNQPWSILTNDNHVAGYRLALNELREHLEKRRA